MCVCYSGDTTPAIPKAFVFPDGTMGTLDCAAPSYHLYLATSLTMALDDLRSRRAASH